MYTSKMCRCFQAYKTYQYLAHTYIYLNSKCIFFPFYSLSLRFCLKPSAVDHKPNTETPLKHKLELQNAVRFIYTMYSELHIQDTCAHENTMYTTHTVTCGYQDIHLHSYIHLCIFIYMFGHL